MKKILFLLAYILLVGCSASGEIPDPIEIGENRVTGAVVKPYQFDYKGHKYIYFSGYQSSSIVHDPDCSCCKEEASIW